MLVPVVPRPPRLGRVPPSARCRCPRQRLPGVEEAPAQAQPPAEGGTRRAPCVAARFLTRDLQRPSRPGSGPSGGHTAARTCPSARRSCPARGHPGVSPGSTPRGRRPWAGGADSACSAPKRVHRSRPATATTATGRSLSAFIGVARWPPHPEPTSVTVPTTGKPWPVTNAITRATCPAPRADRMTAPGRRCHRVNADHPPDAGRDSPVPWAKTAPSAPGPSGRSGSASRPAPAAAGSDRRRNHRGRPAAGPGPPPRHPCTACLRSRAPVLSANLQGRAERPPSPWMTGQ